MTVFPLGELQNFCDCLWQLRDDMSLFVPLQHRVYFVFLIEVNGSGSSYVNNDIIIYSLCICIGKHPTEKQNE